MGNFYFFRIWSSAEPRPIINAILQSLDLDLVSINVYAKVYQNIPNGLRVVGIFSRTDLGRTSVIVEHTESQPSTSLSVDFLLVVH